MTKLEAPLFSLIADLHKNPVQTQTLKLKARKDFGSVAKQPNSEKKGLGVGYVVPSALSPKP